MRNLLSHVALNGRVAGWTVVGNLDTAASELAHMVKTAAWGIVSRFDSIASELAHYAKLTGWTVVPRVMTRLDTACADR